MRKTSSELSLASCATTTHAAKSRLCRHSAQMRPLGNASVLCRVLKIEVFICLNEKNPGILEEVDVPR